MGLTVLHLIQNAFNNKHGHVKHYLRVLEKKNRRIIYSN